MRRPARSGDVTTTLEAIDRYVGGRLRALRLDHGLTQAGLAARCGVAYQQVAKYERGENSISASRLFVIAEALDTTPAFFFDGIEEVLGSRDHAAQRDESGLERRLRENQERIQLSEAFRRITDRRTRDMLMTLSRELASRR